MVYFTKHIVDVCESLLRDMKQAQRAIERANAVQPLRPRAAQLRLDAIAGEVHVYRKCLRFLVHTAPRDVGEQLLPTYMDAAKYSACPPADIMQHWISQVEAANEHMRKYCPREA